MRVRNSTRFHARAPGRKRDAHRFLAHGNDGTATPQNRRHMHTLRDHHAQSTMRIMTSDFRAPPTLITSRPDLPDSIATSVSQTTSATAPDTFPSRRTHAE